MIPEIALRNVFSGERPAYPLGKIRNLFEAP